MIGIIILTILSALGATLIVTKSFLFEDFRTMFENEYLATLFSCPQCFGEWMGLVSALLTLPIVSLTIYQSILYVIAISTIVSLLGEIIEKVIYE